MKGQRAYVPPPYVPLEQSDLEPEAFTDETSVVRYRSGEHSDEPAQWSSGICACFDDIQSCCVGLFCPCIVFGKNAETSGSGTFLGSCMTHFILWASVNTICCFLTNGITLGLPGCLVACYACGYRSSLRAKHNLQEAPCGDFATHFFCHPCAICQEYREIRERSADPNHPGITAIVAAPPPQTMELPPKE